jgi:hypothetical protein
MDPQIIAALITGGSIIIGGISGIVSVIIKFILDRFFPIPVPPGPPNGERDGESRSRSVARRSPRRRRGYIWFFGGGLIGLIVGLVVLIAWSPISDLIPILRGDTLEPCTAINGSTSPEPIVPNPQPSPPYDVTFEDDFSNTSGEWPEGESDGGFFRYAGGGYLLNACQHFGGTQARAVNAGNLRDVMAEVDAKRFGDLPDEEISYWGIVCRVQGEYADGTIKDGYFMGIWNNGLVEFRLRKDDKDQGTLDKSEYYPELVSKGQVHNIRAGCVGNELTLWVDGREVLKKVLEDEEAEFTSGTVGLFVYKNVEEADPDTEVLFDNFKVYNVE